MYFLAKRWQKRSFSFECFCQTYQNRKFTFQGYISRLNARFTSIIHSLYNRGNRPQLFPKMITFKSQITRENTGNTSPCKACVRLLPKTWPAPFLNERKGPRNKVLRGTGGRWTSYRYSEDHVFWSVLKSCIFLLLFLFSECSSCFIVL